MTKETVDRLIGFTAILISLLTLVIFIYQTNIIYKQSRLSVTPRLSFNTQFSQKDTVVTFIHILQNKGIGPAIIYSSKVELDGKEYEVDFENFFDTVYPELSEFGDFNSYSSISDGQTLTANEAKILFSYTFPMQALPKIQSYLGLSEEDDLPYNIRIRYQSIYEEAWEIDSDKNGHPVKIN